MTPQLLSDQDRDVVYPVSDGRPMGESTLRVKWIFLLYTWFQDLFRDRADVFVAADLFWYPVKGDPRTVYAPDLLVAFGRPKGERSSYLQWNEGGVAPQVVFEVLSPANDDREMGRKREFYERFGVQEYYEYDPESHHLSAWFRQGAALVQAEGADHLDSPLLGVRFEVTGGAPMRAFGPDGEPLRSHEEVQRWAVEQQRLAEEQKKQAEQERRRAEREHKRAEKQQKQAEQERQRAEEQKTRAEQERKRAEELAEKLRQLGVDPDSV